MLKAIFLPITAALVLTGCTMAAEKTAPAADVTQDGAAALKPYADAVNSNNVDTLMALTADDIVLQAPGYPEVIGQAAAREFAAGYFAAFTTAWEKTSLDFIVVGDNAFSRYSYRVTDTSKADGSVHTDTGKGLLVYKREGDAWHVLRDSWSSDKSEAH